MRFGRLVIVKSYHEKKNGVWSHLVLCDCGTEKLVRGGDMAKGTTFGCGCGRSTHGMSKSPEYKVWASMIQRCTNKKESAYSNYGGRGIKVSSEWNVFDNFLRDMGLRPDDSLTLERLDNDKGYCKDNCKWASRFDQAQNQRIRKDNRTGFVGVTLMKDRGLYVAHIQRNKKRVFLGSFKAIEDAVSARREAEILIN